MGGFFLYLYVVLITTTGVLFLRTTSGEKLLLPVVGLM